MGRFNMNAFKMLRQDLRRLRRKDVFPKSHEEFAATYDPQESLTCTGEENVLEKKKRITEELNETYILVSQELNGVLD